MLYCKNCGGLLSKDDVDFETTSLSEEEEEIVVKAKVCSECGSISYNLGEVEVLEFPSIMKDYEPKVKFVKTNYQVLLDKKRKEADEI